MSKNLLLKISGSIASYKSAQLVSDLKKQGWDIQVVMTEAAEKFIGATTFEGLTGRPVMTSLWKPGEAMSHIQLDRWANLVVYCPATANTINKLSAGIGTDLPSNLFLAHDFKKPYLIVPAMNEKMWFHPATKASVERLKSFGIHVMEPDQGELACGENGAGRLPELEKIKSQIQYLTGVQSAEKILVTLGGTEEPIDEVRSLTNTSTGRTGTAICDLLANSGFQVTAVAGRRAVKPAGVRCLEFQTTDDLEAILKDELEKQNYSAVVHSAAISDFQLAPGKSKMDSSRPLVLELTPREKTLSKIRGWSANSNVKILGFKLTAGQDENSASRVLQNGADAVVINNIREMNQNTHPYRLMSPLGHEDSGKTNQELAQSVQKWLKEIL